MTSLVQQQYKQLVKRSSVVLKSFGFSKRGDTFRLDESGNVIIISFQRSQRSTKDNIIFTLNIGVCSRKLFEYQNEGVDRIPSSETDCHLRLRIGHLLPQPEDKWWEVSFRTDIEALYATLELSIVTIALPYLRLHCSDSALITLWESGIAHGLSEKGRIQNLQELRSLI